MYEIRNTEEAIDAITMAYKVGPGEDNTPRAISWAPGDMTRYIIALIKMKPLTPDASSAPVEFLFAKAGDQVLVIPKPRNEFGAYSAELFLARHGDRYAGWWSAMRPLLAGLGWTQPGDRSMVFSHADANTMATALNRLGRNLT